MGWYDDPQNGIDAEVAVKCPRCGHIDPEATLYGFSTGGGLSGECEACGGPVTDKDSIEDEPEPDYEYLAHGDGADEPPGDVW